MGGSSKTCGERIQSVAGARWEEYLEMLQRYRGHPVDQTSDAFGIRPNEPAAS